MATPTSPLPHPTHPPSALPNQEAPAPSTVVPSVVLPSNTVVGLGLGFVAAALCVVGFTVLVRVRQVRRALRQARQNGEPGMPFSEMWGRWGGWWGLLFAPNDTVRTFRLKVRHVPRPEIWDVCVADADAHKDELADLDQPLAAGLYGKERKLGVSVLVAMPAPNLPPPPAGEEAELPNVMLGTTFSASRMDGIEIREEEHEVAHVVEVEMVQAWHPPAAIAGPMSGGTTMWTGPFRPRRGRA